MNKVMKTAKKILAVILTIVLCAQTPVIAAAPGKYISEVRLSSASSDTAAKKWLTDNGYEVLDVDLNQKTNKDFVFLGYKTTDNPDEAIRDMKVMNMNGGFVVNDGSAEIQKMWNDMEKEAGYVMDLVQLFSEAYSEGSVYAELAYQGLNTLTYSSTKGGEEHPLGDYFLDGVTVDDLVQIMFFADQITANGIYNFLALGILKNDSRPWMEKAVENIMDTDKQYTLEEEDRAEEILPAILAMGDLYRSYVQQKENDDNVTEEDLSDLEANFLVTFEPFRECVFSDTDMGTYLTNPDITFEEVLPIASALSDEQVTLIILLGMMGFEPIDFNSDDYVENVKDLWEVLEISSVWEGVDRDFYDHPVAVTVEAANESKMQGDGAMQSIFTSTSGIIGTSLAGTALIVGTAIVISRVVAIQGARTAAISAARHLGTQLVALKEAFTLSRAFPQFTVIGTSRMSAISSGLAANRATAAAAASRMTQVTTAATKAISAATAITIVVVVAILALVIGLGIYDYYNPTLTAIPYTMFDAVTDENDKTVYTRYSAALSHKGDPADLNAKSGQKWNALYTTKDPKAGKPILADFLAKSGDNITPDGYSNVSFFGYSTAANLNVGAFKGGNDHYLFFKPDTNYASTTASVFTPPFGFVFIATAFLIGGAAGAVCMKLYSKRVKKESETTTA